MVWRAASILWCGGQRGALDEGGYFGLGALVEGSICEAVVLAQHLLDGGGGVLVGR